MRRLFEARSAALWLASLIASVSASLAATEAEAQTQKCAGERWEDIASQRYGDARLGQVLASFNRAAGSDVCTPGRFVRLPATIQHEVVLGQTIKALADRFLRAPGGIAFLREHLKIPEGTEPAAGTTLELPAELAIQVGTRPEAELAAIPGLPGIEVIKRYNAVGPKDPLPQGGTIYVPIFLVPKAPMEPPPGVAQVPKGRTATTAAGPGAPDRRAAGPAPAITVVRVPVMASTDHFSHSAHRPVLRDSFECQLCHVQDPQTPHQYLPIPTDVCTTCHSGLDETSTGLRPQELVLTFSHALHLTQGRKVAEAGYKLVCDTCHAKTEDLELANTPTHSTCVRCHNNSEVKPSVQRDCAGCHAADETPNSLASARLLLAEHFRRSARKNDLFFPHQQHVEHAVPGAEGADKCERCHTSVRAAETLGENAALGMKECLSCHRGLQRQLESDVLALDRCRTCHYETRPEINPSFATVTTKPLSHSTTFRLKHGALAKEDRQVCQSCHPALAGGDGENCERCHAQMRPRDHTVRWMEEPHGRAAERRPDRCATCHLQDRCADCHRIRPRDHFPEASFLVRHNVAARSSTRRCQACHLPELDCARCHNL